MKKIMGVVLFTAVLSSGSVQAKFDDTVYSFCTVLLNENLMSPKGDSQWAVSSVFETSKLDRKHLNTFHGFNSEVAQRFSNYSKNSLGGYVAMVNCSHHESRQDAVNERSEKISGDRNSGEKVTTISWSFKY